MRGKARTAYELGKRPQRARVGALHVSNSYISVMLDSPMLSHLAREWWLLAPGCQAYTACGAGAGMGTETDGVNTGKNS